MRIFGINFNSIKEKRNEKEWIHFDCGTGVIVVVSFYGVTVLLCIVCNFLGVIKIYAFNNKRVEKGRLLVFPFRVASRLSKVSSTKKLVRRMEL